MDIKVPRGKYVLAVSGGVDSMVLLDLLARHSLGEGRLSNLSGVELIVAHFNHGIRPDSHLDEELVSARAKQLGLAYEGGRAALGGKAGEDAARRARYDFLATVRRKHKAKAIITAHHQDDLIETALINLLRGTNRRGLTAIADNPKIVRPLLNLPKAEIHRYAKAQNLEWREDSTNQDTDYLRNHIRLKILPGLSEKQRQNLLLNLRRLSNVNGRINGQIATLSRLLLEKGHIDRQLFAQLPDKIARELLVYWLRQDNLGEVDKYEIERLSLALKTARAGTSHDVKGKTRLVVADKSARFTTTP